MVYIVPVRLVVEAYTPAEAVVNIISELQYLLECDSPLVAYYHPRESEVVAGEGDPE